jgi:adenylate cyclase
MGGENYSDENDQTGQYHFDSHDYDTYYTVSIDEKMRYLLVQEAPYRLHFSFPCAMLEEFTEMDRKKGKYMYRKTVKKW